MKVALRYRLRDPLTGLFLACKAKRPSFAKAGLEWVRRPTAEGSWLDYRVEKLIQGDNRPDLELVSYKITIAEHDIQGPTISNNSAAICAKFKSHNNAIVPDLVRSLVLAGTEFKYIAVVRSENAIDIPENLSGIIVKRRVLTWVTRGNGKPPHEAVMVFSTDEELMEFKLISEHPNIVVFNAKGEKI